MPATLNSGGAHRAEVRTYCGIAGFRYERDLTEVVVRLSPDLPR